jgi:hypothetical protein
MTTDLSSHPCNDNAYHVQVRIMSGNRYHRWHASAGGLNHRLTRCGLVLMGAVSYSHVPMVECTKCIGAMR